MNKKLTRLVKRRELLIAQIVVQRRTLRQITTPWLAPLTLADQGLSVLNFARNHVAWIVGGGSLLSVLLSLRLGKYVKSGLVTWLALCKLRGRRPL
ncbi:MAG: hypothetical protein G3H99_03550 [Ferrovum sp.]|nr:hypothetical protein [Ferrovum sp.]NDU87055.1 hypothetical protein [Ferrovum sp.]